MQEALEDSSAVTIVYQTFRLPHGPSYEGLSAAMLPRKASMSQALGTHRVAADLAQLHGQVAQVGQVLVARPCQQAANLQPCL